MFKGCKMTLTICQKRDPIPGLRRPNGSIATNDADKAQILANHFETVFTRESSLLEVVPQSRTDAAKIDYAQINCGDVERILKSLKKTNTRARMAFHQSF